MAKDKSTRLVKPFAKGQITIPAEFRKQLGIDESTLLRLKLIGSKIEITPVRIVEEVRLQREYSNTEIDAFLEDDKVSASTVAKVRKLLEA
ncbi:MAG: AbrB/MazE/SpoVT family DNA-binding domain-containing protein [Anaerolineales bacterium]|nr:AbrB/MazE/SpoVT family DNA-binding domain-containing protein [Anaerolineales bacterium]